MQTLLKALEPILPAIAAALVVVIGALGLFARDWLKLRSENAALKLKRESGDIDDTQKRNELDAKDRELIQMTYAKQVEDIRRLDGTIEHHRNMIDGLETKLALAVSDISIKDERIRNLEGTQRQNVERIKDLEEKADKRHLEMNAITVANFQLTVELKQALDERTRIQSDLDECNRRVKRLAYGQAIESPADNELSDTTNKGMSNESELPT